MEYFLYAEVDLPAPPAWLIEKVRKIEQKEDLNLASYLGTDSTVMERKLIKDDKVAVHKFIYSKFFDDTEALAWANEISDGNTFNDVRYTYTAKNQYDSVGPHRDHSRNYTLIYVLESGASGKLPDTLPRTVFYKTKEDSPIEVLRPPTGTPYTSLRYVTNYSDLEVIGQAQFYPNKWYILNASILHSVEGVAGGDGVRTSIQISYDAIPKRLTLENKVYYSVNT